MNAVKLMQIEGNELQNFLGEEAASRAEIEVSFTRATWDNNIHTNSLLECYKRLAAEINEAIGAVMENRTQERCNAVVDRMSASYSELSKNLSEIRRKLTV